MPYRFRGGRGARGTGSPDPFAISNPRVFARVHLWNWVPSGVHLVVRGGAGSGVGVVGGSDLGFSALVLLHVRCFL